MKKVKCINSGKFKNLTKDREYEITTESEETYTLVANNGTSQRYSKKYFEDAVKPLTAEVLLERMTVEANEGWYDGQNVEFFIDGDDHFEGIECPTIVIYTSPISCGIVELGISFSIERFCNNICEDHNSIHKKTLFVGMIRKLIDAVKENADRAVLLISVVITNVNTDLWNAVIDNLDDIMSHEGINPQTEHLIRTMMIPLDTE